jgi:adenylosuccinate lyase
VDGILSLYINIIGNLTVYPKMIEKHLKEELPFMAAENILMYCVKKGGDRQSLHERIRLHAVEAAEKMKKEGGGNDFISRILADSYFDLTDREMKSLLDVRQFIGRAKEQTEEFLAEVAPVLKRNRELFGVDVRITV